MDAVFILIPIGHIPAGDLGVVADDINRGRRRLKRNTAGVTSYKGKKRLVLADKEALAYLAQDRRWEGAEIKSVLLNT